jgi:acyl-CoA dehydrogenase
MDLELSPEEKLIKETAARFVDREMIRHEGAYLRQVQPFLPPGDPPRRDLDPQIYDELARQARAAGLWMLDLPEQHGGSGLSMVARVLIQREFGRSVLPFRPVPVPPFMFETEYGERLAQGDMVVALVLDEAHKTGELSQLRTLYREEPDGCILRDSSLAIGNPRADLFLVPAREQGTQRLALFALERDLPGMAIGDEVDLTTDATVARLTLHQCKVPAKQLVGYEYEAGAAIASAQLAIGARSLGIAQRCLAAAIEHARNRVTFGRRLAERQAIQWMLADLSVALRTATWLTMYAAWRADQELPYFEDASLAKKRGTKTAFQAADTAIQIHGGYGVCKEFPFEAFYRESRLLRLLYGREEELDAARGERFLSAGA